MDISVPVDPTYSHSSIFLTSGSADSLLNLLLDHRLPLAFTFSNWEVVDLGLDLCPPFAHVVFNVKDERVLPKVSVHHLPGGLKTHRWVQVGLQR